MWAVLYERYLAGSLNSFLYPNAPRIEMDPDEKSDLPIAPQTSSSSAFQETLNEPVPSEDVGCVNFPKSTPVEEDAVIELSEEGVDNAAKSTEQTQADIETAMERWVEMVESVVMLETIDWLDKVPDTSQN